MRDLDLKGWLTAVVVVGAFYLAIGIIAYTSLLWWPVAAFWGLAGFAYMAKTFKEVRDGMKNRS